MDAQKVGKKIAELRKKNKMTQRELAEKLNVIDKTVSRWECGYGLPDIVLVPEIAKILQVNIEDIIGEPSAVPAADAAKADAAEAQSVKAKTVNYKLIVSIGAAILAVLITLAIVLPLTLKGSAPAPDRINGDCFQVAKNSNGNHVFITAFGYEECMSLELWGNDSGRFACQESWVENKAASVMNCKITGRYTIENDTIVFNGEKVIDPHNTAKLRLDDQLGLDGFVAGVEYGEDGSIAAIAFSADTKNGRTSAFGRWTKYANYFSRVTSEICFERVLNGQISFEQCLRLPEFARVSIGATIPYRISCDLARYEYYVGETVERSDITVKLVYADGSEEKIDSYECEMLGRELTLADTVFNVHKTTDLGKMTAAVKISVGYGYSWERAQKSAADFSYFTVYKTYDYISLGALELYGSTESGRFIYSENCGKNRFTSDSVVVGRYTVKDDVIRFVSTSVYVQGNYQSKFYINSEGDWFNAYAENDFEAISFKTGNLARHLFGHFCTEPSENCFSRVYGDVYFERVHGTLSARAQQSLAAFAYLAE